MLYDILFIDNDFGENPEATEWPSNARKLFGELMREGLRVTYTTGEKEDIESLKSQDLSCIQYIFCDLHLYGINANDQYGVINGNIVGILEEIQKKIASKNVTIFINSKYLNEKRYGDDGLEDLKNKIPGKFSIEVLGKKEAKKNELGDEQKNKLQKNNLDLYIKSLVINKAVDVEKELDKRLKLNSHAQEQISFHAKFLIFQSQFDENKTINQNLPLLKEIRNKIAHTNNDFSEINSTLKKRFWKIIDDSQSEEGIKFSDFANLITYIQSVDDWIDEIDEIDEIESAKSKKD